VCDAVQTHSYPIDGVWVSNFVTPAWFNPPPHWTPPDPFGDGKTDHRYDFAKMLGAPLEVSPGGVSTTRVGQRDERGS
jgi:hypothetical protein